MSHSPLLAAGIGEVLPAVVILFTIVSAIVNYFKEKAQANRREQEVQGNRDAKRDPQLQSEIEQFLEQVSSNTPRSRSEFVEVTDADLVEDKPKPRGRKQQKQQQREQQREQQQPAKPKTLVSDRHLESKGLGNVRQRHVQSQVGEHHLSSQVGQSHLKGNLTGDIVEVVKESTTSALSHLLATPDDVRNALMLNEILSPPVSRRKKS